MDTPLSRCGYLVGSSSSIVYLAATARVEKPFRANRQVHTDSSHRIDLNLGKDFSFKRTSDPSQRSTLERGLIESMQTGGNRPQPLTLDPTDYRLLLRFALSAPIRIPAIAQGLLGCAPTQSFLANGTCQPCSRRGGTEVAVTSLGAMSGALLDALSHRVSETSSRPTRARLQRWDPLLLPDSIPFARMLALDARLDATLRGSG